MIRNVDWIDLVWPMMSAACLTLGVIHAGAWLRQRNRWDHLMFAASALCVAALAFFELGLMHATTLAEAGHWQRFGHLPTGLLAIFLAGFAHFHFGGTRRWMVLAVVFSRVVTIAVTLARPTGVNYSRLVALHRVALPGGVEVSVLEGVASRWNVVHVTGVLLLTYLVASAAARAWRRSGVESRPRIARLGGALTLFLVIAPVHGWLIHTGVIRSPYFITPVFCLVILAMASDLTADVVRAARLAEELRTSYARRHLAEERFRRIVESTPCALVAVDGEGRVTFGNRQAVEMFGYPREELEGMQVERLLPESQRARHGELRSQYAEQPALRSMSPGRELAGRRRDGSEFPCEIALAPFPGDGDRIVLAMIVDISERRRAEQAAALQRAELTHLSRVAVLGQLSSSIAHELNQPLAAILSNAEAAQRYLRRSPVDLEQLREIVDDIVADDERAGEVIRRLRAMLRKEEVPHVDLDVNAAIRGVLQILHSELVNRGVAVEPSFAADLPAVSGDAVQLQQILLNLIVNACDAMADLPPPRVLRIRTSSRDGDVLTEISDRGTGIPEAEIERIFAPFVTTKKLGTGLGLAVCRDLVQSHGGRIWARNNPDGGATLAVALPAAGRGTLGGA